MSNIKKTTEYVERIFDLYDLDKREFFFQFDTDTDEYVKCRLFPFTEMDDDTLEKISVHTGLTKEEIINNDEDAAKKYWNKYSFFSFYKQFKTNEEFQFKHRFGTFSPKENLVNAIFGDVFGTDDIDRFNVESIIQRLKKQLKEIDNIIPGTYHVGAKITNLEILTEDIVTYTKCQDLLNGLLEIIERTRDLFIKAVENDLPEDEANELNFLVSWFDACDVACPSKRITYDKIVALRKIYEENLSDDFFGYIKLKRLNHFEIWRCKEFYDNKELVQQYANVFPALKENMRKFSMAATKFLCTFVWSDAKPIVYSEDEEELLKEFNKFVGEEDIPIEERAKERTTVYVEKTNEELGDFLDDVEKIKILSSTISKGGIKTNISIPEYAIIGTPENWKRLTGISQALVGGSQQ